MRKFAAHILITGIMLFVFIGLPCIYMKEAIIAVFSPGMDAVASASVPLPDKPSGEYVLCINRALHEDTLEEWVKFFNEEPVGVIFEDISCIVMESDASGIALAERYMLRLPENQMNIKKENPTLAVSKLQWGRTDIFIASKEMADIYALETAYENGDIYVLSISGDDGL